MQIYSQKKITGNDQKNNGQNFWEILERIIGKIASIIGSGLLICEVLKIIILNVSNNGVVP